MTKTEELRNTFIKQIEKENKVIVNELNGNYFNGADVAVCGNEGVEVYRVLVIKYPVTAFN